MKDKKDNDFRIRLEQAVRQEFSEACGSIGETMSRVIRDLMMAAVPYIREHCAKEHRWYPPVLMPGLPTSARNAFAYPHLPSVPVAIVAESAPTTMAGGRATTRRRGGVTEG